MGALCRDVEPAGAHDGDWAVVAACSPDENKTRQLGG